MDKFKKVEQRILPHSAEAEQSVLGCVLIDQNAAVNIVSDLKKIDFYTEAHRIIFECMQTVYFANLPIDFITLIDELEKKNMLDSVGGAEYITTLTNAVPSSSNYQHYIDIVKRGSILRQLISASNEIIQKSFSGIEKEDALAFAEKIILDISNKEDVSSLTHIKESVHNIIDKFQTIQKDKTSLRGLPTGIYGLDKITNGLQKSDLILIAARPSCGKSSLALNIANYAAIEGKRKVAVFSLEMPKTQLAQRSLCSIAMVSMEKALKGELDINEWKALWAANEKIEKSTMMIDDSSLNTPSHILSKCRRMKAESGLDLVVIDYLQLMSAGGRAKENRQQEISEMSRSLKIVAKELDVPVILLSQLSRAVEMRKDHRPILSDLRESGAIEQDADIVIFIYRSDLYNDVEGEKGIAELIIAKHRNGPLGVVKTKWLGEYTTFANLTKDSDALSLEKTAPKEKGGLQPLTEDVSDDLSDVF